MTVVVLAADPEHGAAALDWALAHRDADEHVHLVLGGHDAPGRAEYTSPAAARRWSTRLEGGSVPHTVHPGGADPAHRVVDVADRESARLVVLGLPRRRPTMKVLLGSHVQTVLADAACPVVCVR